MNEYENNYKPSEIEWYLALGPTNIGLCKTTQTILYNCWQTWKLTIPFVKTSLQRKRLKNFFEFYFRLFYYSPLCVLLDICCCSVVSVGHWRVLF